MEKDDFMRMMQENGAKGEEYDIDALRRAGNLACAISMLVGISLILLKLLVNKEFDFGICAIIFLMTCIQYIYEGIKLGKWWLIIGGIIAGVTSFLMLIMYVGGVFL